MNKLSIFLASSIVEFKNSRPKIGEYVLEYNNAMFEYSKKIKLFECEFYDSAVSLGRKQDDYMEVLKKCDLFMMLIGKKLGNYTKEEYEMAVKSHVERHIFFFKEKKVDSSVFEFQTLLKKDKDSHIYEIEKVEEVKEILYQLANEKLKKD